MNQKLFTAWHAQADPGASCTLFGYVTWAQDENQMRDKLRTNVHKGWGDLVQIAPGVLRNDVTQQLWGPPVLQHFEQCARDGTYVSAAAKLVMNAASLNPVEEPEVQFARMAGEQRQREVDKIIRMAIWVGLGAGLAAGALQLLWHVLTRAKLI